MVFNPKQKLKKNLESWIKLPTERVEPAHYVRSADLLEGRGIEQFHKMTIEKVEAAGYVIEAEEILSNIRLRLIFSIVLLSIFGVSVMLTYALIFLWGYGAIHLDKAFAHWLGGATAGQTATLLVSIVRYLFPSQGTETKKKRRQPNP